MLSRDLLLSDVWGYRYTGGTRTVDVHVRRLREKLPVLVDALVTVKQFGYKLADGVVIGRLCTDDPQRPQQALHRLPGRRRPRGADDGRCSCHGSCAAQERDSIIERRLADESKLIADLLASAREPRAKPTWTARPTGSGALVSGRVTLIAGDGRVVGDSTQTPAELPTLENHASRPEVLAAGDGRHRHEPALQHHAADRHGVRGHAHRITRS